MYLGLWKIVIIVGDGSVQSGRLYKPEQNIAPIISNFPSTSLMYFLLIRMSISSFCIERLESLEMISIESGFPLGIFP